jgi:hypothetical protein
VVLRLPLASSSLPSAARGGGIAAGYIQGLREAMGSGEIAAADPQVLAWALMGVGEIIGMRWILWGDTSEVPPDVFEEALAFVIRGLGAADRV